ncbi:hypothetical protein TMatcc_007084 [Talaromyces marneffei ATCC 18224]|uniref:Uncharacterized protein n=1 Tax=Talaromyces marneffei (strain ATCC 18224 / CBS 334.59 / QM 7333) TaxID=441960 RepID=B6QES5_TALMQ|nr:uncharacterized protein EYB26_004073 [Talaromyces marneffei]EEA24012.1 conserved hypothetical protein [Talaromyces marneffei ATCC 18224]KAE8553479.1 hypothetical protein EYB25_004861 [Talaromyces marneffei]QGA16406.1 hypothetical protein EYB26_004073 [Talaromyces marneffei]
MSRSPQTISMRLAHLIKAWPTDPVRPASVSVQTYLQSRLPKTESETPQISQSSVIALTNLLNDQYSKQYPLPQKLRYPASNPTHYDDVVREFEEAPNRTWLGRIKKRLGGMLRLK